MRFRSVPVIATGVFALASAASAQTISSGDVSFTLGAVPTSPTVTSAPTADLRVSGPAGLDHMGATWWWYRAAGDTREFALSSPTSTTFSGDTAILNFSVPARNFLATLVYRVLDLPGADSGVLLESMTVINTGGANLAIDLFLFREIDLAGTATGDTATVNNPGQGQNVIQIVDGQWRDYSDGTNRYHLDSSPQVLTALTDGVTNNFSSNAPPTPPQNYQHGFQWTLNVLPFAAATVTASETITRIPSPSASVLLLGGGLLMASRRRR